MEILRCRASDPEIWGVIRLMDLRVTLLRSDLHPSTYNPPAVPPNAPYREITHLWMEEVSS